MGKFVDLTGMKFGRWEVLKRVENKGKHTMYLCKCSCKKQTERNIQAGTLVNGNSRGCGCIGVPVHGLSHHTLYSVWNAMTQRCSNPNTINYHNYGGRGIKVCEEWKNNFKLFYDWCIANGWKKGLQIDRIDNNKDYEPNNCQWITPSENNSVGKKRKQTRNTSGFEGALS